MANPSSAAASIVDNSVFGARPIGTQALSKESLAFKERYDQFALAFLEMNKLRESNGTVKEINGAMQVAAERGKAVIAYLKIWKPTAKPEDNIDQGIAFFESTVKMLESPDSLEPLEQMAGFIEKAKDQKSGKK